VGVSFNRCGIALCFLKLRQVSAGGCNACEADTHVLTTVGLNPEL
jgi:hypothetical protein